MKYQYPYTRLGNINCHGHIDATSTKLILLEAFRSQILFPYTLTAAYIANSLLASRVNPLFDNKTNKNKLRGP
jgi:hypothetical protein